MKINLGIGITVVALLFVAFILRLVFLCSEEKVDLVSDNYYENEIKYQERIDQQQNAMAGARQIRFGQHQGLLSMQFPSGSDWSGTARFFRPDNARLDFDVQLSPNENGVQEVSLKDIKPGNWKVMIEWSDGKVKMYQEEKIWVD